MRKVRYISVEQRPRSLLAQVLGVIVGVAVLVVSVVLGAFAIAALVGLVLILALVFIIRVWWFRRQMEKMAREQGDLEADYTIVRRSKIERN